MEQLVTWDEFGAMALRLLPTRSAWHTGIRWLLQKPFGPLQCAAVHNNLPGWQVAGKSSRPGPRRAALQNSKFHESTVCSNGYTTRKHKQKAISEQTQQRLAVHVESQLTGPRGTAACRAACHTLDIWTTHQECLNPSLHREPTLTLFVEPREHMLLKTAHTSTPRPCVRQASHVMLMA